MEVTPNELFLSDDEVIRLTGRKRPTLQIEQLEKQRIPFLKNASGRPIVIRDVLSRKERKNLSPSGWSSNKGG